MSEMVWSITPIDHRSGAAGRLVLHKQLRLCRRETTVRERRHWWREAGIYTVSTVIYSYFTNYSMWSAHRIECLIIDSSFDDTWIREITYTFTVNSPVTAFAQVFLLALSHQLYYLVTHVISVTIINQSRDFFLNHILICIMILIIYFYYYLMLKKWVEMIWRRSSVELK